MSLIFYLYFKLNGLIDICADEDVLKIVIENFTNCIEQRVKRMLSELQTIYLCLVFKAVVDRQTRPQSTEVPDCLVTLLSCLHAPNEEALRGIVQLWPNGVRVYFK